MQERRTNEQIITSVNELIPNVRKFVKKLQITIHSIGAIKIEVAEK